MSIINVHIYVASDKDFKEFSQSVADILDLKLEIREGKVSPYMLSFHIEQGIYVECYMKESGRVYRIEDRDWGLFEYKLSTQILWTDPIEGQVTEIQVPLPISLSTTKEDVIQAHIIAGKYIFGKLKEFGRYRILLDRDYNNLLDKYDPDKG